MTDEAKRPVPHINHTVDLAKAANALANASVPDELERVANPMDVAQVRAALQELGSWFQDPNFYFPDDPDGELHATEYLITLASTLREHLKAGNTT